MNPPSTLAGLLEQHNACFPDKPAFIFPGQNQPWDIVTYRQLFQRSEQISRGFKLLGIPQGTRAALMVSPSLDFFALAFAMLRSGVVPVIVDPAIGLRNVTRCLAESQPRVYLGGLLTHFIRLAFGWGKDTVRWNLTISNLLRAGKSSTRFDSPEIDPSSEAAIIYTSGSTGLPKGAIYTHANFSAQIQMLARTFRLTGAELDLPAFPLFALIDCLLGITAVIPNLRFPRPAQIDPVRVVSAIQFHRVDTLFASPTALDRLARYGAKSGESLPSLKRVITAGAPAPVTVLEQFRGMLDSDAQVYGVYGSTETLPVSVIDCQEVLNETRFLSEKGAGICIGRPVEGASVAIIPISDTPVSNWDQSLSLPASQIGEIIVKGPAVTAAYVGREEGNRLAKIEDADGQIIHRMGDLGYFDLLGRLWYCGRKSHRVVLDGVVLFTEPVEGIFNAHPLVYRTALVGVEHNGQVEPALWVQLEAQARMADQDTIRRELLALAADTPEASRIRTILFHPDFPSDVRHNSKIIREELAKQARRRLA